MIKLVVAASDNNVIGDQGKMPWRQHDDLQHFKSLTICSVVIMGRKTFDSLKKPLPNRVNVVVTRDVEAFYKAHPDISRDSELFFVFNDLADAIKAFSASNHEVYIIGGSEIYKQTIGIADVVYLTRIHTTIEGDAFFSGLNHDWKIAAQSHHKKDEKNDHDYSFITYVRA